MADVGRNSSLGVDAPWTLSLSLLLRLCFEGCMPSCSGDGVRWTARLAAVGLTAALASAVHAFIDIGDNATLIPLPEIITDPNAGETVGILPVVLISEENTRIRRIIAPDVRYNPTTGVYPSFRLFEYPSEREKVLLQAGKATKIGEYFEASYTGESLFDGWLDVGLRAFHENDPFERFFGFGNDTQSDDETNYTGDVTLLLGSAGVNLRYALQFTMQTRLRVVRVREGGLDDVSQLVRDPELSDTPGVDGATLVGQRFSIRYDTRDSTGIPSEGDVAEAGIEFVDRALGSSVSFIKYDLEARSFIPLCPDKRFILALQTVLDYVQGSDQVPFYERSALGGVSSLRGFGSKRFVDNHRFFARSELRCNVWEPQFLAERLKVLVQLEVAPFVEVGRVFRSSRTFPLEDPHVVGGVGFRGVVRPQVVGYVDFGTTGDSPSVFTGIDYPF